MDGKEYELTEKHENVMQYIKEAKAISQGDVPHPSLRSKSPRSTSRLLSSFSTSSSPSTMSSRSPQKSRLTCLKI